LFARLNVRLRTQEPPGACSGRDGILSGNCYARPNCERAMSDDAGLAALISGILGGSRADGQASGPHTLAKADPSALTSAPATAPPAPEMPPPLQEEPVTGTAPPAKRAVPAGGADEKRARLPAAVIADLVL